MKIVAPLRVQAVPSAHRKVQQSRVVQVAFGDDVQLTFRLDGEILDMLFEFGEKMPGAEIENAMHRVEPQRIDVKLLQPIQSVLNEERTHRLGLGAVEIHRLPPGSAIAPTEDRTELAEIIPFRAEVIVYDVQDHGYPASVSRIDEPLERPRPSVGILRGKRKYSVVAPVSAARKLRHRHDLDRRNPKFGQIIEPRNRCV